LDGGEDFVAALAGLDDVEDVARFVFQHDQDPPIQRFDKTQSLLVYGTGNCGFIIW
jgi:hypothetical protein